MKRYTSDIAFTPAVKSIQARLGSRDSYHRMEEGGGWSSSITPDLVQFIGQRDSFYLATASVDGQPYIQHRGGPPGFLRVLDESTLAFADYSGNRQYISAGNLSENNQVSVFLMDYPNKTRIKIWGTAKVVENDQALLDKLHSTNYKAKLERAIVFTISAWDTNCQQHIQERYTVDEFQPEIEKLKTRIADLENQLEAANLNNHGKI